MDFDTLLARARRLELKSRFLARSQYAGLYRSAFRGQGMEFAEVREYAEGDEVRLIDWNVSARHQSLYVKRMVEERERNVLLILDTSGSLAFGSVQRTKFDLLLEVGALLVLSGFFARDRVSLALVRAGVELFVPAAKGWNHAARLIRELVSITPGGAAPGLDPVWNFVNSPGVPRSLMVFLTDFQAPLQASRSFSAAGRKHEMVFILALDPREWVLPAVGRIRVRHPETGQVMVINSGSNAVRREYERSAGERRAALLHLLRGNGAEWVELSTGAGYESSLRRFLLARASRHPR
ncbi:MAG: DUF58 domain-containing protein [Acidobacteriia bacterium]|nr:DUF58 domain-containing protein [Terriglobia bacterium]